MNAEPMIEHALAAARAGLRVHPVWQPDGAACSCPRGASCPSPGKHPIIDGWQDDATADEETIRGIWQELPHANVGIATGAGVFALDVDGPDGEKSLAALETEHGTLPDTRATATGRGHHVYFRCAPERTPGCAPLAPKVDVRGAGGNLVGPGSLHASGRRYALEVDAPIAEAPAWLLAQLETKAPRPATEIASATPAIDDEKLRGDFGGAALGRRVEMARAALAALEPSIAGQHGDDQLFRAACVAARDHALPSDRALELLREYNTRCQPPWDESRLRYKIDEAREKSTRPLGDAIANAAIREALKGSVAAKASPAAPATSLRVVRVGEVPDPGPAKWLIEGLWTERAFGITGAEPKSWKSWLTLQLAVCVAAGKPAFKQHKVKQGRVLVFSAEGGAWLVRSRVAAICRALDVDINALDLEVIDAPSVQLDDAASVAQLWAAVEERKPALLVLDPLREMHGGDENDSATVARLLLPLRTMQHELGCAIMVVHHMAKMSADGNGRRLGQRLRGSSALHGAVDSALYLEPKGEGPAKRVKVTAEHRAAPALEPLWLQLRDAYRPEGKATWLEVVTPGEGDEHAQALAGVEAQAKARAKVLLAIKLAGRKQPLKTRAAVTQASGLRKSVVVQVMDDLLESNAIEVVDGAFRAVGT